MSSDSGVLFCFGVSLILFATMYVVSLIAMGLVVCGFGFGVGGWVFGGLRLLALVGTGCVVWLLAVSYAVFVGFGGFLGICGCVV